MFKNKFEGKNNICGKAIYKLRLRQGKSFSQKKLADLMQIHGVDLDKNAIQRIESGQRFVTDIELIAFATIFKVRADYLLGLEDETVCSKQ